MFRIIKWLAIGLGVVLVLLIAGVAVYTRTAHFQELLRTQLLSAANNALDAEVTLERVSHAIWQGLTLHNLVIRQQGKETVVVPEAALSIDLLRQAISFLKDKTIHVRAVTLQSPVVHLVETPGAGWNVTHLVKPAEQPAEPPKPLQISVSLPLFIHGAVVTVQQATGKEYRLDLAELGANITRAPDGIKANVHELVYALSGSDVPQLRGQAALNYDGTPPASSVLVQEFSARTDTSHVVLRGTVENLAAPVLNLTIVPLNLAAADVSRFVREPRLLQDISGTLHAQGPLRALQVSATLGATDARLQAAVTTDLTQSPPSAQGNVDIERLVIEKIVSLPDVAGEVRGKVSFQGITPATMQATVDAQVVNLVAQGRPIGNVKLASHLAHNTVTYTVDTEGQAGQIGARGQVSLAPPLGYDVTMTLRNLDVTQVPEAAKSPPTKLNIDAWVKGSGTTLGEVNSTMKVAVLPSQVGTTKVTSGEFRGALRDGLLKLDKGELLAEDTTVRVMGEIGGLQGTPSSALTYELQAQNVTPWLALAGLNATGAVMVHGTAQGALSAIATKGTVSVSNFAMNDNRVGRGTMAYALSHIGSQQPQGQVTVDGQNIAGGTRLRSVHADVAFSGLQPIQVQADLHVEDVELRAHHVKVRAQYTPDRTEAVIRDIAVQLPSGVWKNPQDAHLVFSQGKLSIDELALQHAGQSLSVSGTAAQHGPLDLTVQVDQFSLAEVNAFLTDPLPANTIVNADVRVQGTTQQPDATATITTGELKVAGQSYAGLAVKSALRNERLGLNLLLRQDEQHTLRVDGGVPVSLRSGTPVLGDVDLRIHSDGLSLAFVELLNRDIQEVKGALTVDVAVRGPVAQLTPSGTIQLQEASARVKPLGVRFSQIGIDVQLSSNQVTLRQLVVHSDEGQLSGQGTIGLAGYEVKSTDVSITADRFRVIDTKEYRAALSGRLGVSGSLQQLLVRGDLTVVDATARPNLALMKSGPAAPNPTIVVVRHSDDVAVATQQQDEEEREEPGENSDATNQSGVYQHLAMNIDVTIPHDTWVHMREGSIELRGDFRVRKASGEEPNVSGVIETVRGWYAFHGRKFRLEQGKVVLTGQTPPNPSLDVVARYTLPDYKVDVVVGGTVKEPTVTFRSEPSLEQADILSLLMFGKPANALTNVEKSTLQSQAVAAATGAVAEELRSALSQSLAVDNLELDMGESPSQAKVGVGKYLAPGLYVSTTQQVGGSKQGSEVNIEYQIADNWQLKGSSTSEGNSGIDILWRKQY